MVALSACPGRREVVVWASYWRRGRSGNAIGLTKVARQSAVQAQHGPYCSHTEERFSYIWRPHGDLVDYLGRHGRSMVAVLCDGGFKVKYESKYKRFTESQKTMYAGLPIVTEFQYFVKEMRPRVKTFFWILAQNTEIFCYFSMIIAWKYWNSGKCYWKSWNYSKLLLK